MKVSRIRLQGFRTVERGFDCRLQPLTIFTGANNSGKSGVIRALDLFFNNDGTSSSFAPHVRISPEAVERKKRFTILITVWFSDLPQELRDTYARHINGLGHLPVRLRFRPKDGSLDYLLFAQGSVGNTVESGRPSSSILADISQHVVLRVIPENRDVKREFQTELGEAFISMRESVIDATHGKAARATAELHKALDDILDSTLTSQVNRHLGQIIPEHYFRVGSLDQREFARIVMQAAFSHYPMCADSPDGDQLELEQVGAGFQSSVLIALHRAVASLLKKKLILCVEEPEIHLDPNAQRRAYHEWSSLASEENDVEQIIINSHSAFIVNESRPEELIVVRRDGDGRSTAAQLPIDFLDQHDVVHLKTKVLGIRNSDIFFSTGVILVEGDSDAVALRGCLELTLRSNSLPSRVSLALLGLSVIECGGCKSIAPLARVLRQLNIPYVMVFDRDFVQKSNGRVLGERSFEATIAPSFDSLAEFFASQTAFLGVKRDIASRLRSGVPSSYPREINRILGNHNILIARTEHETDFIGVGNAQAVTDVVGCSGSDSDSDEQTVQYLKANHYKQVKLAHVTARILAKMSSARQLSPHYLRLCNDILRVLGLKT